jgi:K+ transporter
VALTLDNVYGVLSLIFCAANYFRLPPNRVVELGAQIEL